MATLEQIGAALKKAHAAGDTENARKLAAAYQAARVSAAGPASVPDAPPEGAAPGSKAYADWAMARVKALHDERQAWKDNQLRTLRALFLEGRSRKEIAKAMGLSVATVQGALWRAGLTDAARSRMSFAGRILVEQRTV